MGQFSALRRLLIALAALVALATPAMAPAAAAPGDPIGATLPAAAAGAREKLGLIACSSNHLRVSGRAIAFSKLSARKATRCGSLLFDTRVAI